MRTGPKSEAQIETLVETIQVFSADIGTDSSLDKCGVVAIKKGNIVRYDGIVLPNLDVMNEVDKERHTYLR